jgi:hypothetical protein
MQRLTWEPKNSHDNCPGSAEGLGALVVAGGEGAELLAASEEVLDQMAAAVGGAVEGAGAAFGAALGDGLADAASAQGHAVAVSRVALVAAAPAGADTGSSASRPSDGASVHQLLEDGRFVLLARSEQDGQRLALALGLEVHLGREAALAAPQRFGFRVPPFAPAACWCARITLPSTKWTLQSTSPAASASCWTAAKTRSQTPASRHRQNRLYTVDHGPYRSGRSRQGAPVRSLHRMPLMIRRWSAFGRPVSGFSGGSNGFSRSHCWSVSSPRWPMPTVEQIPAHPSSCFAYRP